MSTFINLLSDTTFAEKMDTQNALLAALARAETFKIESWAQLRALVRTGLAAQFISLGDQFSCQKEDETFVWDVIGIDCETFEGEPNRHSLTLQLHTPTPFTFHTLPYALYYCQNTLAAGTYYFYLYGDAPLSSSDISNGANQYYYFTLTKSVPAKGHIFFPWSSGSAASVKISTYSDANSETAIETVPVTQGKMGTLLPSDQVASVEKIRYGHNHYTNSQVRAFLNSRSQRAFIFKTSPTGFEHYAGWPEHRNGFMYGMDTDFIDVLWPVKKKTKNNTITFSGEYETTQDLFFLPSASEVMGVPFSEEGEEGEGAPYPYYVKYLSSKEPHDDRDERRVKFRVDSPTSWMLRSPEKDTVNKTKIVNAWGSVSSILSAFSAGIAPLCVIA